jgi:branched-chain amino acid transport system ATP-binding protein
MTELLTARNVTRRFGGLAAVESVSLSIQRGDIHGLIGPNGAGKTTFVNMITGVERLDSGTVHFHGKDVTGLAAHRMASRGMARSFQTSQLFEDETVIRNVMAGRHRHIADGFPHTLFFTRTTRRSERNHRGICLELLEQVGLQDVVDSPVSELSYGRRRLVELARAMASEPDLLVLDEPAAGLPGSDVDVLARVLTDLPQAGFTVLIIEHNIGLLMDISDQLTVLSQGRVLAEGDPMTVRHDPAVVEAYLGSAES